jgi:hypothetical protein
MIREHLRADLHRAGVFCFPRSSLLLNATYGPQKRGRESSVLSTQLHCLLPKIVFSVPTDVRVSSEAHSPCGPPNGIATEGALPRSGAYTGYEPCMTQNLTLLKRATVFNVSSDTHVRAGFPGQSASQKRVLRLVRQTTQSFVANIESTSASSDRARPGGDHLE